MSKDLNEDQDEPLTPTATDLPVGEVSAAKGNKRKFKIIAIITIVVLIIIGAGVFFFFKVIKNPKKYENANSVTSASKADLAIQNTFVNLEQMLINLAPSGPKPNYLKISIILQVSNDQETQIITAKTPLIVDAFQTFLRELRAPDFSGSGSMIYLKEELLKRVNKITYPIIIKEILFKELVVN